MKKRESAWQKLLNDMSYRTITGNPDSKETKVFAITSLITILNGFLIMFLPVIIDRNIADEARLITSSAYQLDLFFLNILGGSAISEWSIALIYRKGYGCSGR